MYSAGRRVACEISAAAEGESAYIRGFSSTVPLKVPKVSFAEELSGLKSSTNLVREKMLNPY